MIWDIDKLNSSPVEPAPLSAAQYALQLVENGDSASLSEAAAIYQSTLADPALQPGPDHAEIESLYGSLLCLQAQNAVDDVSFANLLDQAHTLLSSALTVRQRATMPQAWATSSANLALVYITRYFRTNAHLDVMNAHIALDGTLEVFTAAADQSSAAWVRSLSEYLGALVERRQRPR